MPVRITRGILNTIKDNPMIKYSHVFEIELNGEKSWLLLEKI